MLVTLEVSTPPSRMEKIYGALLTTRGQLTLTEAARLVYLSPSTFSHQFTKHAGKSFRAVRVEIKLQVAATLLQQTNLSIPEIARTPWVLRKVQVGTVLQAALWDYAYRVPQRTPPLGNVP